MKSRRAQLMGKLIRDNAKWFIGSLLCTIVCVFIEFVAPLLLAETLDYYLSGKPSTMPQFVNNMIDSWGGVPFMRQNLWLVGLALILLNFLSGLFSYLRGRWQATAGENVSLYLREKMYHHIQRLPFSYHVKAETGDLVQRCTSDIETVRRFLSGQLLAVFNAVLMIVIALSVLFAKNVKITLISMIMIPALFVFAWLFFKWVVKAFKASDEAEGKMSAILQENLTGVRVVRAFGQQEYEVNKFETSCTDLKNKNFKLTTLLAIYWATGDAMSMFQMMITLIVCIFAAISGEITVGTMVVFTTYIGKLLFPIRQLGRILSDAGKSMVSLERIDEILQVKQEKEVQNGLKPSLKGDIQFDHVTFKYDEKHKVLDDMSFTIKRGETVALLGATGSGKSTIVHLLQKLFDVNSGEIRISNVPIQKMDTAYLRSHIGLILQEPFLYSKTIKENVGIALQELDEERIDQAVQDACAKDFILKSENGFDTVVGERGVTLSGGQKQRVAISRTLLKDNDILVFDNSLSAVDTETDALIRQRLNERNKDLTTIIISHRVTTLKEADRIFVLEKGKITQSGSHDELLQQEGLYARIFNIQTSLEDELKNMPHKTKEVENACHN